MGFPSCIPIMPYEPSNVKTFAILTRANALENASFVYDLLIIFPVPLALAFKSYIVRRT